MYGCTGVEARLPPAKKNSLIRFISLTKLTFHDRSQPQRCQETGEKDEETKSSLTENGPIRSSQSRSVLASVGW